MTLNDQIIDEAEELANNRILYDPTDTQIVDAVSDCVGVRLSYNSIGARLAIAAYNRIDNAVCNIKSVSMV
jgi:hypothetical protein